MTAKSLPSGVQTLLEYGPTVGFVVAYLIFRNDTFLVGETEYSGFVAVTALFIPILIIAIGLLWVLGGTLSRIQMATAVLVLLFGALSVWFNDARFFKMKPTAIYLTLALFLSVGLMRGQSWLKYIMEDAIHLSKRGWMILTRRLLVVFLLAAAANEVVWRTQSEQVWVLFETIVMPLLIVGFFLSQMGLFIEYGSLKRSKKKR